MDEKLLCYITQRKNFNKLTPQQLNVKPLHLETKI